MARRKAMLLFIFCLFSLHDVTEISDKKKNIGTVWKNQLFLEV